MGNYKGIAYRSASQTIFIDMAAAPGVSPGYAQEYGTQVKAYQDTTPYELTTAPWSPWGRNNLFPQEMVADIETCGILNGIIDTRARFALCEGIVPAITERDKATGKKVVKEWVNDPEILEFLDRNNHFFQTYAWLKDLMGFGNAVCRFMLNAEFNKIYSFHRHDITELRYEKKNASGKIENVYLSAQWDKVQGAKDNRVLTIPLLDEADPVKDMTGKAAGKVAEHALTFRYPGWGKHYYSTPLWYSAYKWVKIAQGVPEMKAALYENTMRIKYQVTIFPKYWEDAFPGQWDVFTPEEKEAKRNELFDEINDYLCGAKNAHKSLFVDGVWDQVNGKGYSNIEIKAIEDTTRDGELLPDSAAANSEIAFSMIFNPAIIGASLPSGPYTNSQGGSNVRESALMQTILHELERKMIGRVMNVIKYFNGWDKQYPGLEFIIPATVMTTLDTGASSKPVMTGGEQATPNSNPQTPNPNGTDHNN